MTLDERLQLAERLARGEDRTKKNTAAASVTAAGGGALPAATASRTPTPLPSAADRAAAREDAFAQKTVALPTQGGGAFRAGSGAGRAGSGMQMDPVTSFKYGSERAAAGMLGLGESVTDFIGSGFYKGLEGITSAGGLLPNRVSEWAGRSADAFLDNSVSRDYERSIEERYRPTGLERNVTGVGQTVTRMLPSIGASVLTGNPNVGLGLMGVSAGGANAQEAKGEGASTGRALAYGAASGLLEVLTERLSGGIPQLGRGKVTQLAEKVVSNPAVQKALDILGEGGEEIISTVLTPYLQRAIYDPEAENATMQEIVQSAVMGAVSAGVLQLGLELPGHIENAVSNRVTPRSAMDSANQRLSHPGQVAQDFQALPVRDMGQVELLPGTGLDAAHTVAEQAPQAQKTASTGEAGTYRAERPQNVELPTVPIINLSMQDVAELNGGMLPQSGNYLRRTATERAAARLGLNKNPAAYIEASNVTQNGDTYVLKITKSTLKKMLSASSYQSGVVPLESIAVLENLERIANNGVYFKSEGDRYGRDQIAGYDHLMTTVYIDNAPYLVDMRVRVLQQQNNAPLEHTLYHFTPEAMTLIKQDDGGTSTTGRHASSIKSEVPPSSDPTIPQTDGGVNAQSARHRDGDTPAAERQAFRGEASPSPVDSMADSTENINREAEDTKTGTGVGVSGDGVGAMNNPYGYRQKVSQARSNTYEHSGIFDQVERQMEGLRPEDMTYDVATERQSMDHAAQRLAVDYEGERSELPGREAWSGEDLDTAMGILGRETARARESGDYSAVKEWAGLIREKGTQAGQVIQAFAKYTRTPEGVLVRAAQTLEKAGVKPELQQQVMDAVAGFSKTLDAVGQGDKGALLELIRTQARQRGTPVSTATEKALRAQDFQYLYDFALAQLDNIALDYERVSAGRKLSTYQAFSHLFNAKTALRNVVSNQVFDLVDAAANDVGLIPDAIMGMFTGRRTVGLERSWLSGGKRAGALEGAQRGWAEVALDVDMGGATKYGTGGRRTNKMTGTLPSRIMSTAEKAMGFELNVTDEFHKGSVVAEVLESLRPLVERGDVTQAEAAAWAKQEALYRAFQDDTLPGALLAQMKDAMNLIGTGDSGKRIRGRTVHEFGLGDLVQKYTQVPGALMSRAVEFSPVGYGKALWTLARAARAGGMDAQSQRGAALAMGRATTGTGLAALFASLAAAGLLGRADDEEDRDIAALNASEGISGTQLNLSGLERWIAGGSPGRQTGDVLISLDFLEPLNALMTVGALAAQDAEEGSAAGKYLRASLEGTFNAILDTPTMQSFSTIFDTMRYHKADDETPLWLEIPIELAKGSVTGFVPGLIRQSAQAADGVYRDTYTSGSAAGETLDAVKNSLPGLRQTLPVKLTPFGEEKTQGGGAGLRTANAFLMPGALNIYRQSGVSRELERVREEAGAENIYPDRNPPKTVQNGGAQYVLDAEERAAYQRRRGEMAYDLMAGLMESPVYQRAGAEERAGLLSDALSYANDAAKREAVEGRGVDYKSAKWEKAYAALQAGIDFGVYLEYREMLAGEKKRGAASQANANVRQALFRDERLDERQKKLLDETLLFDGFYIPRDMDVDYSGEEAFAVSQMSEGAQKRWPVARDRFGLDAEKFGRAWGIVQDDNLSVTEKKAALRELVGGYQGNALYKALTERT